MDGRTPRCGIDQPLYVNILRSGRRPHSKFKQSPPASSPQNKTPAELREAEEVSTE